MSVITEICSKLFDETWIAGRENYLSVFLAVSTLPMGTAQCHCHHFLQALSPDVKRQVIEVHCILQSQHNDSNSRHSPSVLCRRLYTQRQSYSPIYPIRMFERQGLQQLKLADFLHSIL